jgi:hypothetical protein
MALIRGLGLTASSIKQRLEVFRVQTSLDLRAIWLILLDELCNIEPSLSISDDLNAVVSFNLE